MTTLTAMPKYEAYKNSGIEWIGEIPDDWGIKKLSHLFLNIGSGTTPATGNISFYDGNISWLQTGDLTDGVINSTSKTISERALKTHSTLKQYKAGSLVVAMYGATIGKVGLLNISTATNQACCVLEKTDSVDMRFAFYLFMGFKSNIVAMGYGGGQPNISQDLIRNLRFPFPNQQLQTVIANFLDEKTAKIDEAIAIKEQQIELLKERKQIIIQQAVTQGLDPTVPMTDSGVEWIGQIPAHWSSPSKLKYLSTLKGRQGWQGLKAEEYRDEGPHVLSSAHFNNYVIEWGKCPRVSMERYLMDENIQLKVGDVLLMKDGANMGKLAYVDSLPGLACLNSHLLLFRSLNNENIPFFHSKYMFFHMMIDQFQDYVKVNGTGSTFLGISQESIGNYKIALPPLDEQVLITQFLDKTTFEFDKCISKFEVQIEKLKEYKSTLINSAVTGKIKVV